MRDQYAGDISDMLKYSLLRALAGDDRSLGVCWYYNPKHDGLNDGLHTEYLADERWTHLDVDVWKALQCFSDSNRSVTKVEELPIWPNGVCFHRNPVPINKHRHEWAKDMADSFKDCNIVFLDPDNGLGKADIQHATLEEVKLLRNPNQRSLVLIKFPGRSKKHDIQAENYHNTLQQMTNSTTILTLRTSVSVISKNCRTYTPRARWFTILDYDSILAERLFSFAQKLNEMKHCKVTANIYQTPGPGTKLIYLEKQ